MKRTALLRRTPLRSKPQRRARPWDALSAICEAGIVGVCSWRAEHRHHLLPRSAGGGNEAANTIDVCSGCHSWAHAHPAEAYRLGLLRRRRGA